MDILQQELIRAGVLPKNYDFEAYRKLVLMRPGDVAVTYADTSALERDFGFKPDIELRTGLRKLAEYYKGLICRVLYVDKDDIDAVNFRSFAYWIK